MPVNLEYTCAQVIEFSVVGQSNQSNLLKAIECETPLFKLYIGAVDCYSHCMDSTYSRDISSTNSCYVMNVNYNMW